MPHEIENIYTLQCIEVRLCCVIVEMFVQRVQEEQKNMGNDNLNVSIQEMGNLFEQCVLEWNRVQQTKKRARRKWYLVSQNAGSSPSFGSWTQVDGYRG